MGKKNYFYLTSIIGYIVFFAVFSKNVFAIPAEYQRCKINSSCTIGEFLYDDDYNPIATASCSLTSRYPDGSIFLNAVSMTASTDGWYSYNIDTSNKPEGLYRSQICCTVTPDYLCLDKSFYIGQSFLTASEAAKAVWDEPISSHSADGTFGKNLQNPVLTASDIWSYTSRTLTGFGTLVADIWNYTSRTLTDFGSLIASIWSNPTRTLTSENLDNGKKITTQNDLKVATDSAVASIKGTSNQDLTQLSTQISSVKTTVDSIDLKTNNISTILSKWGSYSAQDIYDKVKALSSDIAKINKISNDDIQKILTITQENKDKINELLNKVLAMQAILDVNRALLEGINNQPIIRVWLEEGSVIFKILTINPSNLEKKVVPFKYYLPEELKRENILKIDEGLNVNFDPKENSLYIEGEIPLNPKETKIFQVEVEDIWKLDKSIIEALKKQTETLFEPLKKTSYFAQASTLKADINLNLDKAWFLMVNAYTPELKIKAYRDAIKEIASAQTKINDLKTLASAASSSNSLFASLSGVSLFGVWAIVLIVIAGFVFLMWYFEKKTKKEIEEDLKISSKKNIKLNNLDNSFLNFLKTHMIEFILVIGFSLLMGLILSLVFKPTPKISKKQESFENKFVLPTITMKNNHLLSGFITPQISQISKSNNSLAEASNSAKNVLGEKTDYQKAVIVVPKNDFLNIRDLPTLDGDIIGTVKKTSLVRILRKLPDWYQIEIKIDSNNIVGWVKKEYVQLIEE